MNEDLPNMNWAKTLKKCAWKCLASVFILAALYYVVICPCDRLGRCHWEEIVGCLMGAGFVVLLDNIRTRT